MCIVKTCAWCNIFQNLINVQSLIKLCMLEKNLKNNKRTCTFIRVTRVDKVIIIKDCSIYSLCPDLVNIEGRFQSSLNSRCWGFFLINYILTCQICMEYWIESNPWPLQPLFINNQLLMLYTKICLWIIQANLTSAKCSNRHFSSLVT